MVQTIGLDMGMAQYATSLASELCFLWSLPIACTIYNLLCSLKIGYASEKTRVNLTFY